MLRARSWPSRATETCGLIAGNLPFGFTLNQGFRARLDGPFVAERSSSHAFLEAAFRVKLAGGKAAQLDSLARRHQVRPVVGGIEIKFFNPVQASLACVGASFGAESGRDEPTQPPICSVARKADSTVSEL